MQKRVFVFTFLLTVIFLSGLIFIMNVQKSITGGESEKALFEIKVEIPRQFMRINPREELWVEVSIFNIKSTGSVDVLIAYQIKDSKGNIFLEGSETLSVEEQKNYIKKFVIPEDAKSGRYMLYATLNYNGVTTSSTAQFVIKRILKTFEIATFFSLAFILILIIIILRQTRKIKEHIALHHKNHHKNT